MLVELNQKIMEVKEKLRMKQKIVETVKSIEQELSKEKTRLEELESALKKEGRNVEKLEGLSVKGLFYTVLGSKEGQLEKERREYLAAKLKFDECKDSVEMLQSRLEELKTGMSEFEGVEAQYYEVFREKEKMILSNQDNNTRKLIQISEKIADINANIKEVKEAINSGQDVLTGIEGIIDSLQSAKGWGTWDLMGGGLISTAIKHSRIDDARESVHQVQHQLRVFQKELTDVKPYSDSEIVIDMGSFATFADYFFDGLISDWIVQSRINDSLENAVNVGDKVLETIKALKKALNNSQHQLEILEEQKRQLIENQG